MANISEAQYWEKLSQLKKQIGSAPIITILERKFSYYNSIRLQKELFKAEDSPSPMPEIEVKKMVQQVIKKTKKRLDRDSYPKELHPAFDRQNQLYGEVNHLHPQLENLFLYDRSKCEAAIKALVKCWQEIDAIYGLLDYYTENQVVLPNKYGFVDAPKIIDRADIQKRIGTLRSYVSRNKNKPGKAMSVKAWQKEIKELQVRLELEKNG